jgi:phosphoglycolate phosphatase
LAGASELLRDLRAMGVKVGIVTRNCRAAVEAILAREPLEYDILLTRDDVTRVKPDPEHLLVAMRALGASPERLLMVGDHPMDVQAGRAVGAWTIGILNDGRPADYFAEARPDAVLSSVAEIPAHLAAHPLSGPISPAAGA